MVAVAALPMPTMLAREIGSAVRPTPLTRERGSATHIAICTQEKRPHAVDTSPSRRRLPPSWEQTRLPRPVLAEANTARSPVRQAVRRAPHSVPQRNTCSPLTRPYPLGAHPPRGSGRACHALSSPRPTPFAHERGSAARPALCPPEKRPPAGDVYPSRRRPLPSWEQTRSSCPVLVDAESAHP